MGMVTLSYTKILDELRFAGVEVQDYQTKGAGLRIYKIGQIKQGNEYQAAVMWTNRTISKVDKDGRLVAVVDYGQIKKFEPLAEPSASPLAKAQGADTKIQGGMPAPAGWSEGPQTLPAVGG